MRSLRALRALTVLVGAVYAVVFVYVALRRLTYPYELDWMSGALLDHVLRVRAGENLYVPPTPDWIPFLYPPLSYWIAAATTHLWEGFAGYRLVSLLATAVQALCIWRLCRRHGATRFWSAVSLGLFFGCYAYTAFFYDLERCDPLAVALLAVATVALSELEGAVGAGIAGALVGLAFLAKQPALLFLLGGTGALLLRREKSRALIFGAAGAVIIGGVAALWPSGGLGYYVFWMPLAHRVQLHLAYVFFVEDLSRGFVLTLATAALGIGLWRAARGELGPLGARRDAILVSMLVAGFLAAASSRMHPGGWRNVLLFWSSFACIAVGISATRIEQALVKTPFAKTAQACLAGLIVLQLGLWAYDPSDLLPNAEREHAASAFAAVVRRLEADGEVIVHSRGHVTSRPHYHLAALQDVIRASGQVPAPIVQAFRGRRYAAVVIGDFDELGPMAAPLLAYYQVAERLDDRWAVRKAGEPAGPTWVLRPRPQALPEVDLGAIWRRVTAERADAECRMHRR